MSTVAAKKETKAPVRNRNRRRELSLVGSDKGQITPAMKSLVSAVFEANVAKNKATKEERDSKKKLESLMAENEVKSFSIEKVTENGTVIIDAMIEGGEKAEVDVNKLFSLVTKDQFLAIVSASQGAVTEVAGSAVLSQCLRTKKTPESLSVKKRK